MHPRGFRVAAAIKDRLHTIYQIERHPGLPLREVVAMVEMTDRFGMPAGWLPKALQEAHEASPQDAIRRFATHAEVA